MASTIIILHHLCQKHAEALNMYSCPPHYQHNRQLWLVTVRLETLTFSLLFWFCLYHIRCCRIPIWNLTATVPIMLRKDPFIFLFRSPSGKNIDTGRNTIKRGVVVLEEAKLHLYLSRSWHTIDFFERLVSCLPTFSRLKSICLQWHQCR